MLGTTWYANVGWIHLVPSSALDLRSSASTTSTSLSLHASPVLGDDPQILEERQPGHGLRGASGKPRTSRSRAFLKAMLSHHVVRDGPSVKLDGIEVVKQSQLRIHASTNSDQ